MTFSFHSSCRKAAFTLIELLVVVAIIAILASLLFPAIARAKDKGKTTKCASNERQLILAVIMYEQDQRYLPGRLAAACLVHAVSAVRWQKHDEHGWRRFSFVLP